MFCMYVYFMINAGKTTEEFDSSLFTKSKGSIGRYKNFCHDEVLLKNVYMVYLLTHVRCMIF